MNTLTVVEGIWIGFGLGSIVAAVINAYWVRRLHEIDETWCDMLKTMNNQWFKQLCDLVKADDK